MDDTNLKAAIENAKGTLEEMANRASVDMTLWDRHANAVLDLCTRSLELEEANTRMREALQWYADQFCEFGRDFEGCGKLDDDACSGCKSLAAISAHHAALSAAGQMIYPMCDDCPPAGYPTEDTRCTPCPRRAMISAIGAPS